MPRPLRFIPNGALVEVTTRTMQGRLLLRPSPELSDIILGIIGKAQSLYPLAIHAFVVLSTHAHFLVSPASAEQLARFMQFVNADIAKEADVSINGASASGPDGTAPSSSPSSPRRHTSSRRAVVFSVAD
jgi:hypothetical protein